LEICQRVRYGLGRAPPGFTHRGIPHRQRPRQRVLVDYNQNAWGQTLASIYSVRPQPKATVSTPITWKELERGVRIEDFRIDNVPQRIKKVGDLWAPLLAQKGRVNLEKFYGAGD
jgi:bifunctional non-homologous end joining protein LigD